jgi:GST-like protein
MSETFTVYGSPGYGSTIVEGALELLGLPWMSVEAGPNGTAEEQARLLSLNPLKQTPVLVTPDGRTLTESSAILIWLGDLHPEAALAPAADASERADYLRWMAYIPAQIYPMYLLKDHPQRWVSGDAAGDELKARAVDQIRTAWTAMEAQVRPASFILGERMSLLDLYVTIVSRWTPRRVWFAGACPKLNAVAERVDALPALRDFWARRFPFSEGWRG